MTRLPDTRGVYQGRCILHSLQALTIFTHLLCHRHSATSVSKAMRLTWTVPRKQDEGPACRSSRSPFYPMLIEIRGENAEATAWVVPQWGFHLLIFYWCRLPPQEYWNVIKAKGVFEAKGSIFTLTIGSATSLPPSVLVDTRSPQPIFTYAGITSSYSSSYATRTALLALMLVTAPRAIILPAINAWWRTGNIMSMRCHQLCIHRDGPSYQSHFLHFCSHNDNVTMNLVLGSVLMWYNVDLRVVVYLSLREVRSKFSSCSMFPSLTQRLLATLTQHTLANVWGSVSAPVRATSIEILVI